MDLVIQKALCFGNEEGVLTSSNMSSAEIKRAYQTYSKEEKGRWGEECAFKATCQIVNALLGQVEIRYVTDLQSGDEIAVYRKSFDDPNEWNVWWVDPARHHRYRTEVGSRPDIIVCCNNAGVVAIEVKNWRPDQYWNLAQVMKMLLSRFVRILLDHQSVPCVLLTTCGNFRPKGLRAAMEMVGVRIRQVRNFPLPCFGLTLAIEEMRCILEEFITFDSLTRGAWDFQ